MLGRIKNMSREALQLRKRRKPLLQAPAIDSKTFIFIGGLHRSGTSILHRLLCEHPQTSGFSDTPAAENEGQHLQTVFKAAYEFGGPGEFAFHLAAHLTETSSLITQDNKDKILTEWGAYYDLSKPVLLEKSPPNLIRSRFLRQLFPGSRFIFIVRHPVAVSMATEKWSSKTITERLLHWYTAHSIMLDDIDSTGDCLVIRYEDFVHSPDQYLHQICNLAGIQHFTARERVEDHNEKYFQDWLQRYEADLRSLEAVLPSNIPILKRFGYTLSPPFISKI